MIDASIVSQLEAADKSSVWGRVSPDKADHDLSFMLKNGLVRWLGEGVGYTTTDKGRIEVSRYWKSS